MHPHHTVARASQLRRSGLTRGEIAAELGVSERTIRRWLPDPLTPEQQGLADLRRKTGGRQRVPRPDDEVGVLWVRHGEQWLKALVDEPDWHRLRHAAWGIASKGYVSGRYERKRQYLHRVVCGLQPGQRWPDGSRIVIDHLNRDPLDNRRANLRICTQKDNCANRGGIFQK